MYSSLGIQEEKDIKTAWSGRVKKKSVHKSVTMIEAEEKNRLLNYLEGKGMVAVDDSSFDDSFLPLYAKHQATLAEDGYLQVYKKPSALVSQMSTYIRITKTGRAFVTQGGYK